MLPASIHRESLKVSNSPKGFSLVELIAVIAIVLILGAILLPVFSHIREKANEAHCLGNIRQISMGYSLYIQDNRQQLPPYYAPPEKSGLRATVGYLGLTSDDYLKGPVYTCPTARKSLKAAYSNSWLRNSYHQNRRWKSFGNSPTAKRKITSFKQPSRAVLLYEQWGADDQPPLKPETHRGVRTILYIDLHAEARVDLKTTADLAAALSVE